MDCVIIKFVSLNLLVLKLHDLNFVSCNNRMRDNNYCIISAQNINTFMNMWKYLATTAIATYIVITLTVRQ